MVCARACALVRLSAFAALIGSVLARLNQKTNHHIWRRLRNARQHCSQVIRTCDVPHVARDTHNCVLRCLSSECYTLVYSHQPLEEGEIDHSRMRSFMKCAHTNMLRHLKRKTSQPHS
ncbi:unnamed protein product [Agarophyton chilense]